VDEELVKLAPGSEEAQHSLLWDQTLYADTLGPEKREQALGLYQRSLENAKEISAHSTSVQRARDVAVVYNKLGMFYDRVGDYANAVKSHQSALQIYEDLLRKDPQNKLLTQGLAIDHGNISEDLGKMGRVREAKAEIAKAIELMDSLVKADPDNASQQGILAEMHVTRAQVLRRSNDPAASLADYKFALKVNRSLFEKDHNNTSAQLRIATRSVGMAKAEMQLHHPESASTSFRTAVQALKPLLSGDKPDPKVLYTAADAYAGLGGVERAQAAPGAPSDRQLHWEAAREWFQLSLEQLNRIPRPVASFDQDIGPLDSVQIGKELSQCEAALRHASH
jgi:tetratricopeptide (TPR) repeat protein